MFETTSRFNPYTNYQPETVQPKQRVRNYPARIGSLKRKGTSLPSAAIGLCLIDRHPSHSRGGYSTRRGLNTTFTFGCPRSPRLVPWVVVCLLTNELLSKVGVLTSRG